MCNRNELAYIEENYYDVFHMIVDRYFQNSEKILIELIYIEKFSTTCLTNLLKKNNSFIAYAKNRLYLKFKDYCEIDYNFNILLDNTDFLDNLSAVDTQLLFYFMKLYSKPDIIKLTGIGYNRLVLERKRLMDVLKKYDVNIYNKIIEMRKKYKGLCILKIDKKFCDRFTYEDALS